MDTYPVGYRVVSKHTGIEYEIVEVLIAGSMYRGKREDGSETPLAQHGIVPSTLQNKQTWETPALRRNIDYVTMKASEVPAGAVIYYGSPDETLRVVSKVSNSKLIKFWLEPVTGIYNTAFLLELVPDKMIEVKSVPDDEKEPVTLQPLGGGTYRVNAMNRSAVTGRYNTYKYAVGERVGKYVIDRRRSSELGDHTYKVSLHGQPNLWWISEKAVDNLAKGILTGELVAQESKYKYKIGEKIGDYEVVDRMSYTTGQRMYLLSKNGSYRSIWSKESDLDVLADKPQYKYEIGQKWDNGSVEIIGRSTTTGGKRYYTLDLNGKEEVWEECEVESAGFVEDAVAPNKRPATSIGVMTKIKVEGEVWMVKDIHLERNNQLVSFGCVLVSEGIDGAWDYKTHKVYTDSTVEVVV